MKLRLPLSDQRDFENWLIDKKDPENWSWVIYWGQENFFTISFFGDCSEIVMMCKLCFPNAF